MNAKEFLEQYRQKTEQIEALENRIAEMRAHAEKCTSVLSLTPGGNAHNDSRLEELVIKINTMEEQLGILWEERGGIFIDTVTLLSEIPKEKYRQVLTMRYLEGMSFCDISDELLLSRTRIYDLHKEAITEFEQLIKERKQAERQADRAEQHPEQKRTKQLRH